MKRALTRAREIFSAPHASVHGCLGGGNPSDIRDLFLHATCSAIICICVERVHGSMDFFVDFAWDFDLTKN